ncbi:UNVERIFIED_CONTAM: hypothetical protein FKN15_050055 [Acipenser sinensis]
MLLALTSSAGSEVILKIAYSASAFASWVGNCNSILEAYQSLLLRSLSENHRLSPQQLDELCLVNKNLLHVAKLNGSAIGRNLVARRQIWLFQARVPDGDKGHVFGPTVGEMLQRSHCTRQSTKKLVCKRPPPQQGFCTATLLLNWYLGYQNRFKFFGKNDDVDLEALVNDMNSSFESLYSTCSTQSESAPLLQNGQFIRSHIQTSGIAPMQPTSLQQKVRRSQPVHILAVRRLQEEEQQLRTSSLPAIPNPFPELCSPASSPVLSPGSLPQDQPSDKNLALNTEANVVSDRSLEDHEHVVQVQSTMASESKFVFRKNYAKYEFFKNPANFFPEQMVAWCQETNSTIPPSQLLQEPRHLQLLADLEDSNIFSVITSKKLYNAPTDFGFCIKYGILLYQNYKIPQQGKSLLSHFITPVRSVSENSLVAMDFSGRTGRVIDNPVEAQSAAMEEGHVWRKRSQRMNVLGSPSPLHPNTLNTGRVIVAVPNDRQAQRRLKKSSGQLFPTKEKLLLFPGQWTPYKMHVAEKLGLAKFAPVEASVAILEQVPNLALLYKDTTCPNKQCRVSELLLFPSQWTPYKMHVAEKLGLAKFAPVEASVAILEQVPNLALLYKDTIPAPTSSAGSLRSETFTSGMAVCYCISSQTVVKHFFSLRTGQSVSLGPRFFSTRAYSSYTTVALQSLSWAPADPSISCFLVPEAAEQPAFEVAPSPLAKKAPAGREPLS